MKNKILVALFAIMLTCALGLSSAQATKAEGEYAPYVSLDNWGGTYGAFGVTEKWNGISLIYDGWYTKALSPSYISVQMKYINFQKSIGGNTGYAQESIFDFAFLPNQYVTPDWNRTRNGLYIMTRNVDGNLYVQITVKGLDGLDNGIIYEETLDMKISAFSGITLKGNDNSTELYIGDFKIESPVLDVLPSSIYSDQNGYTFFSLESYSAGGSGTDEDKRLLDLYYIKEFESQTPDPSILPPEKPISGEEDYEAPSGLGLTAKKYSSNVEQLDDGVKIDGDAVLYTPLLNGWIKEEIILNTTSVVRIGLDCNQSPKTIEESIPLAIYLKNEDGFKASIDNINFQSIGSSDNITIQFIYSNDVYKIIVNDVEFLTNVNVESVIGSFGTFIKYSLTGSGCIVLSSMYNPVVNFDILDINNWNSPFNGITKNGEDTIIYAHSTIDSPFDKSFLSFEFKINGLLDSSEAQAFIGFELMSNNTIFDPWQVKSSGIVILLRKINGRLQFKMDLYTEFMGTIAIHDWTDLDINPNDRIKLVYINDKDNDTYRVLFNGIEVKGSKMNEIITLDASDRNDKSYFGIALWHDNTKKNDNIFDERSIVIYSIDNVFDEGDIPDNLRYVGQDPEPVSPTKTTTNNNPNQSTTNSSLTNPEKKNGCKSFADVAPVFVFALFAFYVFKRKRDNY